MKKGIECGSGYETLAMGRDKTSVKAWSPLSSVRVKDDGFETLRIA